MEMALEALAGKVAKMKIVYDATLFGSLLEKYPDRDPEQVWEEVGSKVEFSYLSVTVGADNTPIVTLRAEIPGELDFPDTAAGASKIYFN
ncbi:TPA: hypothetical protein REW71_001676 [Klebsiella pneumoniae]|nr:hypothetical protein [Klebsiella pneumoniae]